MNWLAGCAVALYLAVAVLSFLFIRARWVDPVWSGAWIQYKIPAYCMAFYWPCFWPVYGFLHLVLLYAERRSK